MKKSIMTVIIVLMTMACSGINSNIYIPNFYINKKANEKIYIKENLIADLEVKNVDTRVKDGKIHSTLSYSYGDTKGIIKVATGLLIEGNKLYLKDVEFIRDSQDSTITTAIEKLILKAMEYKVLYDFSERNIIVDDIELTNKGMTLKISK
ncbi:hypothetical protein [Oceanivirga salmonicida]|uniref:hypothetical protein n=1 Tax=Oceanivirga salmonicida TaxID=1769291 RepID=UPI000836FB55|nr:hypothetical protein [Oceanivirga salmonicida]